MWLTVGKGGKVMKNKTAETLEAVHTHTHTHTISLQKRGGTLII